VQPDIPKPLALNVEIPVPAVVIWDGKNSPAKTLIAPLPEKPPVADIKPSIQLPNEETNLADLAIPATNLAVPIQPVLPSTTSPVVVSGPKPTPPAPLTTAESSAQPTPTAVISLSEHHMANGAVTLPPINETAATNSPGALAPGQAKNSAQTGHGNQAGKSGKAGGKGAGQGSAGAGNSHNTAANAQGSNTASGQGNKPSDAQGAGAKNASRQTGSGQGDQPSDVQGSKNGSGLPGFGQDNQPSTTHISRPMEGQFGSVVVGSSLQEEYPETADLWSARLSYTVYLHVGLRKNWILQYSLSRGDAAAAGDSANIEAPWPYSIVRPNIAPGSIDADALIIHGFVNQAGRFEALSVAFPPEFPQAQFVLSSLAQWKFRPATQNGQNIKVEVLLVIPEEPE
jgi:hypothetical protein